MSDQPSLDISDDEPTPFAKELESLINRHSKEGESNTPDFILAEYMEQCLLAFNRATNARSVWYGVAAAEPGPVAL